MDTERADFLRVVDEVKKTFPSQPVVPVQLPSGKEGNFKGVVDLIHQKAYLYREDGSGQFERKEIPPEIKAEADKLRDRISEELINDYMSKDAGTATRAVPLLLITRHLERICDHASNIAEDIIYMVEGKTIKHHHDELK
jgi:translation elongation factor EF-G